MDQTTGDQLWVEHWQRVGPLLQKIRHDELRAMSDEEATLALETLTDFALEQSHQRPRTSSGFVEQQRLFLKLTQHESAR